VLPNEATGFKESKIWSMLYDFQKDAALAIINKLEKYNGCILADSVGLGKTFTALSVIKYYENRNKSVLVLCPKKLTDNWNTYKDNYINNPIAADRLRYDVLSGSESSSHIPRDRRVKRWLSRWASLRLYLVVRVWSGRLIRLGIAGDCVYLFFWHQCSFFLLFQVYFTACTSPFLLVI